MLVAEAVARLRTRKLPNPALIGNAGSFFKNPRRRCADALTLLKRDNPSLPVWPAADGRKKLSAAWLIDSQRTERVCAKVMRAFLRSMRWCSSITATRRGAQIWAIAQRVIETVQQRFGVKLEPEPIVI